MERAMDWKVGEQMILVRGNHEETWREGIYPTVKQNADQGGVNAVAVVKVEQLIQLKSEMEDVTEVTRAYTPSSYT